jgi:hypothetical protein
MELLYGDKVVAEVTDVIISPKFEDAVKQTAESFNALENGMISFSCKIDNSTVSFEELKAQWDRLSRPQKTKITERQIFKTMRMRGIR